MTTTDQMRVDIASTLTDIVRFYVQLPSEAVARSIRTEEVPGGDVTNVLGPAANLEAWEHRYEAAEDRGFTNTIGDDYAASQVDTEDHPLLVLPMWEDKIREERGGPLPDRATVSAAASYLRHSITWMFDTDATGRPNFIDVDHLLADLRRVRARLESLLHEGHRPEFGAPCLHCREPLHRIHDDKTGFSDDYRCSNCGRMYLKDQYDYAVGVTYLQHSPTLTAAQIEDREGISATRIRVWGCRYDGLKEGRTPEGLTLYNVAAVLAKRDQLEGAHPTASDRAQADAG